ncbi:MAG: element excision factor XisH family protein [Cyanobacteria bacterium J06634_6]
MLRIENSEEPERVLYLAAPIDTYRLFLRFQPASTIIERYDVRLIIYEPDKEEINQWIE